MMKRRIAIIGSTGSIGTNTLDVVARLAGRFTVTALAAERNTALLAKQAARYRPSVVSIGTPEAAGRLSGRLPPRTAIMVGAAGLNDIVTRPDVDLVVFAASGSACIEPLIRAIRARKAIALANKEALVVAGAIVMPLARRMGVTIVPIDSEHSAIFQCLPPGGRPARILLTGSGGPLLRVPRRQFARLSVAEVLKHPKWRMGKKISVDSATMMNKGLEIIEAEHLFGLAADRIDVLVHPEAIVHSMVVFDDRSVLAQLAVPDMRLPIQYALTHPDRCASPVESVDFAALGRLTFRAPDLGKFPCLGLAREAARCGGTYPAVLNAADEEAVAAFLDGKILFTRIPQIIERVMARHGRPARQGLSLDAIMAADQAARKEARLLCCH